MIRRAIGRSLPVVAVLAALWTCTATPSARALSLRDVLERAAAYAAACGTALSRVVADEIFEQELVLSLEGTVVQRRRLESEIAFVELANGFDWLAFRSVLRVNDAVVADGARRLDGVFRSTPPSALAQARAIATESARHNLGPVQRNFNVPTTVLQFLLKPHQGRFRFRKVSEERVGGEATWVLDFREQNRATFIRTPEGRDAPSHGRLWIVPDQGRVVRSRLVVEAEVDAAIDVRWRDESRLGIWVPAEMRESYQGSWALTPTSSRKEAYDVVGRATYSNYRRFEVDSRLVR
jgi:hypothetical protein